MALIINQLKFNVKEILFAICERRVKNSKISLDIYLIGQEDPLRKLGDELPPKNSS